jgi:DNA-binding NtrC family response regulator
MTLSSLLVSRDWQEVSVLECILGGLHIAVDVESGPERARAKLAKSKIDALIVDCDLSGAASLLLGKENKAIRSSVPLLIMGGSSRRKQREIERGAFVFEKPISVEQAVHTLSAARNMIVDERLRYHRQALDLQVSVTCGSNKRLRAHLMNLSRRSSSSPVCSARKPALDEGGGRSGLDGPPRQCRHPFCRYKSAHQARPATLAGAAILCELDSSSLVI